jgi:hypothetical protein
MSTDPADFITVLQRYGAGLLSVPEFQQFINRVIVSDAPVLIRGSGDELAAEFSFAAEASMYLDMVTASGSPDHSEQESRRLATSLAALGSQIPPDSAGLLAHFARWAPETIRRTRAYLQGSESRASFETFVSRRPWPDRHKTVIKQLTNDALAAFAHGLDQDDYRMVGAAITELAPRE